MVSGFWLFWKNLHEDIFLQRTNQGSGGEVPAPPSHCCSLSPLLDFYKRLQRISTRHVQSSFSANKETNNKCRKEKTKPRKKQWGVVFLAWVCLLYSRLWDTTNGFSSSLELVSLHSTFCFELNHSMMLRKLLKIGDQRQQILTIRSPQQKDGPWLEEFQTVLICVMCEERMDAQRGTWKRCQDLRF